MTHPLTPREKVDLKPCPFCGGDAVAGSNFDNDHYVMCGADCDRCGGMVGYMKTEMAAIENWNRRTALASGSGDHAELERLAEEVRRTSFWREARDARDYVIDEPCDADDYGAEERPAYADWIRESVLSLIAANKALNAGLSDIQKTALRYHARATEAELKLAEAVGIASKLSAAISWLDYPFVDNNTSEDELRSRVGFMMKDAEQPRAMLSKEAERG